MLGLTDKLAGECLGLIIPGMTGWQEVIIVLLALLLLFGGKKLPELARGLGRGLRLFKRELKGIEDGVTDDAPEQQEDKAPQGKPDSVDKDSKQDDG